MFHRFIVTPVDSPAATLLFATVDALGEKSDTLARAWLDTDDSQHYRSIDKALRARQFLLGRILLKHAVAQYLCCATQKIKVTRKINGMPLVASKEGRALSLGYSVSHSREWVVVAASNTHLLGLDIEYMDTSRNISALSQFAFGNAPSTPEAFYHQWTRKEALCKLRESCNTQHPSQKLLEQNEPVKYYTAYAPDAAFLIALCGVPMFECPR